MRNIRKILMMAMVIIGLQVSCYAAQQDIVDFMVRRLPEMVEGFDIMQAQGLVDQNLHDFIATHLVLGEDEMPNVGDVIEQAEDVIYNNMLVSYVPFLQREVIGLFDVNQQHNPIILYVQKYYDRTLRNQLNFLFNGPHNTTGETLLRQAAINNKLHIIQQLIGIDTNINRQDAMGRTPLSLVASLGYVAIADALLNAGANRNIPDIHGRTALAIAMASQNPALIQRFSLP